MNLKNKEINLQQKHKRLRDQMNRKQKFEEMAAKKMKDRNEEQKFLKNKKAEHYQHTMDRQRQNNE